MRFLDNLQPSRRQAPPVGLTSFLATHYSLPMALFPLSTPIVFAPCAAAKRGGAASLHPERPGVCAIAADS